MTSPYKNIEELAYGVKDLSLLDSHYSPLKDIKGFIESLPKPDVVVILHEKNILVYTNSTDQLGVVLTKNADLFDSRYMFNTPKVVELSGNAELWQRTWKESLIATSVVKFLENFITKNT